LSEDFGVKEVKDGGEEEDEDCADGNEDRKGGDEDDAEE